MEKEKVLIIKNIFGKIIGEFKPRKDGTYDLSFAHLSRANLSRANLSGANLSHANLPRADLSFAHLSDANLFDANLSHANLSDANLSHANLSRANLSRANLFAANLSRANLSHANLPRADLSRANLSRAYLFDANLSFAHLSDANLFDANLSRANLSDANLGAHSICPEEGEFIAWKKLADGVVAKLLIPADAKRVSSLVGRKCRASRVVVVSLSKGEKCFDNHTGKVLYRVGEEVAPDSFDGDIRVECTNGIHFFITKKEAEEY